MANVVTSQNIDSFLKSADNAAARTALEVGKVDSADMLALLASADNAAARANLEVGRVTSADMLELLSSVDYAAARDKLEIDNVTQIVDTINDLIAFSAVSDGVSVLVLGYGAVGDGGGGQFYWDATSTETDNGGTIIQPQAFQTGRWKRTQQDQYSLLHFGGKAEVGFNNISALTNALSVSDHLIIPKGTFELHTSGVNEFVIREGCVLSGYGFSSIFACTAVPSSTSNLFILNDYSTISNLYLTDTVNNPQISVSGWSAVYAYNKTQFNVESVKISGFTKPVNCTFSDNYKITNCDISNAWSWGVEANSCSEFEYNGNLTHHNGVDGMKITAPETGADLWVSNESMGTGYFREYAGNLYRSTTSGISGVLPPTHTSGTATDGGVTWNYESAAGSPRKLAKFIISNCRSYSNGRRDASVGGPEPMNGNGIDVYTGGYDGIFSNCYFQDNIGAGIYAKGGRTRYYSGEFNIVNCVIENQTSSSSVAGSGHGIAIQGDNSRFVNISNCRIANNDGTGLQVASGAAHSLTISNTTLASNKYGGLNFADVTSSLITNCVIMANGEKDKQSSNVKFGASGSLNTINRASIIQGCTISGRLLRRGDNSFNALEGIETCDNNINVQEGATGVKILENTIVYGGYGDTSWDSLRIDANNCIIQGNTLINPYRGVKFGANTVGTVFKDNVITGAVSYALLFQGCDDVLIENTTHDLQDISSLGNLETDVTVSDVSDFSESDTVYWDLGLGRGRIASINGSVLKIVKTQGDNITISDTISNNITTNVAITAVSYVSIPRLFTRSTNDSAYTFVDNVYEGDRSSRPADVITSKTKLGIINETANTLTFSVKYEDGTVKSSTINLT